MLTHPDRAPALHARMLARAFPINRDLRWTLTRWQFYWITAYIDDNEDFVLVCVTEELASAVHPADGTWYCKSSSLRIIQSMPPSKSLLKELKY